MHDKTFIARKQEATASQDRLSLPMPLTSFVGREQEIATVCELLRRPEVRLLTLTGTGGVGKTRLSLQVAARLTRDFTGQMCFLSLMETNNPDFVVPTIAKKLGLQDIGTQPILDLLKAFLKEKHLLLLLDNFEQVIDAAPVLIDLLGSGSGFKILVTSREVLRISGEYTFCVPPLALPDLAQLPEQEELLRNPAIALFLERTRTVLPDFAMNEGNARTIAEICTHLDGLPLAIELAVPRLKVLSPQALLKRLDNRLQVLTHGVRDAPGRQQTLRNTLEWSYRLLTTGEQQLFRCLSIFVGGCTLQAIETIWEMLGRRKDQGQVLDGISSLLDKSMIQRSDQDGEESRLLMLRTIREYGLECLSLTEELEQTQWAHASYYLALAEDAEPELRGPQPLPWLELLEREYDNLREAFCFLIAYGENEMGRGAEQALRQGSALERFWIIRGHVKEGRDFLERALRTSSGVSSSLRGKALLTSAALARHQSDFHYAMVASRESLDLFRELGDSSGIARSLFELGYVSPDYATRCALYEESLAISRREQGKEVCSEILFYFASMVLFQGDTQTARTLINESLALFNELGDLYGRAAALNILGLVLHLQGNEQSAACALQEESLAICRMLGNQRGIAHALSALAQITSMTGDFKQAYERYEESLKIMLRLGDRWMVTVLLEGLARVALAQGEAIWTVHLLSASDALRQIIGTPMMNLEQVLHEQALTTLHDLLDEQTFAAAWAEGQVMSPEQALAASRPLISSVPASESKKPVAPDSGSKEPSTTSARVPRYLHDNLTQREREVLRLLAEGLTSAQISEQLVIGLVTVNSHIRSIYNKLGISSRSAATRYAMEHHLL